MVLETSNLGTIPVKNMNKVEQNKKVGINVVHLSVNMGEGSDQQNCYHRLIKQSTKSLAESPACPSLIAYVAGIVLEPPPLHNNHGLKFGNILVRRLAVNHWQGWGYKPAQFTNQQQNTTTNNACPSCLGRPSEGGTGYAP